MSNQQTVFFDSIRSAIPDYQNLALSVAEALGISTNEAYKKTGERVYSPSNRL